MKKNKAIFYLLFLAFIPFYSCSHVNQDSKNHYDQQSNQTPVIKSHGFRPLSLAEENSEEGLDPKAVKRGRSVYKDYCFACHGKNAEGDGPLASKQEYPPRNLRKTIENMKHFKLYINVSKWMGEMPGWKADLSQEQIDDVGQYIKSLASKSKS